MNKLLEFFSEKRIIAGALIIGFILSSTMACSLPFRVVWNGSEADNQQKTIDANSVLIQTLSANDSKPEQETETGEEDAAQEEEEIPPETPTSTLSPTATDTPAPEQVSAQISKNTNCRIGPKDVFELIHIFLAGDQVDVLGKNQDETFWYVTDKESGDIECWIWKEYATVNGNTEAIPVFTPPPEPAPYVNFVASYKDTTGQTTVIVNVRNTGNQALQSYSATFKDTVTSESVAVAGNKFGNAAKVSVGNIGVISSPSFSASTIGHQMTASIKCCSADGQGGSCKTISINFESK